MYTFDSTHSDVYNSIQYTWCYAVTCSNFVEGKERKRGFDEAATGNRKWEIHTRAANQGI